MSKPTPEALAAASKLYGLDGDGYPFVHPLEEYARALDAFAAQDRDKYARLSREACFEAVTEERKFWAAHVRKLQDTIEQMLNRSKP